PVDPKRSLQISEQACRSPFSALSMCLFEPLRCHFPSPGVAMSRREFITIGIGVTMWPLPVWAQQPKNVPRIGFMVTGSIDSSEGRVSLKAFYQGLREYGYIDGQNILVEVRAAD